MAARIIGIGQAVAGDDGVGIAVIRKLRETGVPADIEMIEAAEPSAMIPYLIDGADPIILVDAVVGAGAPGRLLHLEPGASQLRKGKMLSTHGVGVIEAIELAGQLGAANSRIVILGITIDRPARYGEALSPAVAAAVARAADEALRIARR
jgi:hydrogenase maturation protease